MTRLLALAAVAAAAALTPPAAQAVAGPPTGRACHVTAAHVERATGEEFWAAEVDGGPVAAPGEVLSLRCSIHVENAVHSGPAAAAVSTAPGDHAVALVPTALTYPVPYEGALQAVCTEATVGTTTWYWTGGDWTTDPDAPCPRLLTSSVEDLYWCFLFWGVQCVLPPTDELVCSGNLLLRPGVPGVVDVREDGDVYLLGEFFWDCPPYDWPES